LQKLLSRKEAKLDLLKKEANSIETILVSIRETALNCYRNNHFGQSEEDSERQLRLFSELIPDGLKFRRL